MEKTKERISLDQIIFAIPAALYLATPLLDMFVNFYRTITSQFEFETFKIIPYLPIGIAVIMGLSLILFFVKSQDKNIFRALNQRTLTFQTTLLIFVIYLGLIMMSIAVNGFTSYALHGHPYTKMSMWIYITNVLLYFFFSSLLYEEKVKAFLVKMCCYIASAYALYSILGHIFHKDSGALHATFHNSNHYGYYLAVSIALTSAMIIKMLSAEKNEGEKKSSRVMDLVIWFLLMAVQCVALAYNNTLGAWLAVLFCQIFLFIVYRVKDGKFNFRVLIPLGLFLLVSIISSFFTTSIFTSVLRTFTDIGDIAAGAEGADMAGSGRWKIWKWTVRHIIDRPIFGNGIEGILEYTIWEDISTGSPHNEFLEYAVFFGIPAALSYIAAIVSVFIHGLKYKKEINPITLVCIAGAFSYLVSSFFGVCFYYTVVYNFIFLGLSLNFANKDRPGKKKDEAVPEIEVHEEAVEENNDCSEDTAEDTESQKSVVDE